MTRKRVWLLSSIGVALVVIGIVAWLLIHGIGWIRFRRAIAEVRARGEPLEIEALVPPPIPDEENAAVKLNEAFTMLEKCEEELREDPELEDWAYWIFDDKKFEENREKLSKVLARCKEPLDLAVEALMRPKCRFDIDYLKGPAAELPHLSRLRHLGWLFFAGFRLALHRSPDWAAKNIEHLLALSETLKDEPILISQLVRATLFGFFTKALQKAEAEGPVLSGDARRDLIRKLGQCKVLEPAIRALMRDRAMFATSEFFEDPWYGRWLPATVLAGRARYIATLTGLIDAAGRSEAEFGRVAREGIPDFGSGYPGMLIDGIDWDRAHESDCHATLHLLRFAALRDLARLALALGLHKSERGGYPDALEELAGYFPEGLPADPFTGKPFVYKRTDEGFLIYSLGADGKDDGGKPAKTAASFGDVVWRHLERRAK